MEWIIIKNTKRNKEYSEQPGTFIFNYLKGQRCNKMSGLVGKYNMLTI